MRAKRTCNTMSTCTWKWIPKSPCGNRHASAHHAVDGRCAGARGTCAVISGAGVFPCLPRGRNTLVEDYIRERQSRHASGGGESDVQKVVSRPDPGFLSRFKELSFGAIGMSQESSQLPLLRAPAVKLPFNDGFFFSPAKPNWSNGHGALLLRVLSARLCARVTRQPVATLAAAIADDLREL